MPRKRTGSDTRAAVSRERVLEAIAAHPRATKRDLARVLGVKGADRVALKRILHELEDEGAIARGRKRSFAPAGELPEVAVLEISGQDPDGELLARPQRWDRDAPPPAIVVLPGRDDAGPALGSGERILARLSRTAEGYEARVIKRLGMSVHRVLGVYRQSGGDGRIEPIDRKSRLDLTVGRRERGGAEPGELVVAEPLPGREHGLPRARIVGRLGSMDEPKAISLIAIHAHGIPTEFPREALAEAEAAKEASPRGRTDLRKLPLVTIDPEDARDHDDAVWAERDADPKNRGGFRAIVAIADVAHYVTPDSALDREAWKRGNSAYFPDRVVPMLPERLSADLCSLKEGVDRPCLAVRMTFDAQGRKLRHEFLRGMMRSAARLTYREAQAAFDGRPDKRLEPLMERALEPLWAAYGALARARDARAPLALDLPERRIVLGADGHIASIAFRERLESMRLIEEFMIQANVAAAEALEKARIPLIYRIHDTPAAEKLHAFADYLRTIGMSFAKGQVVKPATFNRILERARNGPHADVINDVVLRTQAQAVYSPDNIGHFGLNLTHYAHFTSPIRRYSDLVVHRALIRAIGAGSGGLSDGEIARLHQTADHISMCERRAMAAERDSVDRYVASFMEDRIGAEFDARITGVARFGVFVRLAETGADGLLPARALGNEFFRHDARRHAMVGERSGTIYRLGDTVRVRLVEAAPLTGGLRFALAEAAGAERRRPAARKGRRR